MQKTCPLWSEPKVLRQSSLASLVRFWKMNIGISIHLILQHLRHHVQTARRIDTDDDVGVILTLEG
jgi:hypothetical protein